MGWQISPVMHPVELWESLDAGRGTRPPGRVSRPVCVQKLIEHLGALLGCARCVPPAQRNPRLDARRHERGPVVLQPDAEQLNRLLDFLWGRALEDEQLARATEASGVHFDAHAHARMARTMVLRTRAQTDPGPSRAWIQTLMRVAARHEDHPDFRPEWRIR